MYFLHEKKRNRKGCIKIHNQTCKFLPPQKYRQEIGRFKNSKKMIDSLVKMHEGKGLRFTLCEKCSRN